MVLLLGDPVEASVKHQRDEEGAQNRRDQREAQLQRGLAQEVRVVRTRVDVDPEQLRGRVWRRQRGSFQSGGRPGAAAGALL